MNEQFVPKIKCRFKIRQDISGHLGFFQGKGVLTFSDVGAFIVGLMTGEKNLREISEMVKNSFPQVENPVNEVMSIAEQLQEAGFF